MSIFMACINLVLITLGSKGRVRVWLSTFFSIEVRPTLMGAFGILFCDDFKRLFYFFFHPAVCFAPVHHDEKEKNKNSFKIVAK